MADAFDSLMARFAGVHVSGKEEAIQAFSNLLGLPHDQASFFLEASGFQLEAAVNLYLNNQQQQVVGHSTAPPVSFSLEGSDEGGEEGIDDDGEHLDAELQAAIAASMSPPQITSSANAQISIPEAPVLDSSASDSMDDGNATQHLQPASFQMSFSPPRFNPPPGFSSPSPPFGTSGTFGSSGGGGSAAPGPVFGSGVGVLPSFTNPGPVFGSGSGAPVFSFGSGNSATAPGPVFGSGVGAVPSFGSSAPGPVFGSGVGSVPSFSSGGSGAPVFSFGLGNKSEGQQRQGGPF